MPAVRALADRLLERDPDTAQALAARWIGEGARYGRV
jgi:hypothetical protein